jgi:hypothetical protein
MNNETEKCYISRDEGSHFIWVWFKPAKGNWSPHKMKDCDMVVYQRDGIDDADHYLVKDFKKKFGITLRAKTKKCVHLSSDLLHNNEDYKLISDDPDRKTSDD